MKRWAIALLALFFLLCGCLQKEAAPVSSAAQSASEHPQEDPVRQPYSEEEILALFGEIQSGPGRNRWTVIDCVAADDFAYDLIGAVLFSDERDGMIYVAFLDGEGHFQRCGVEHRVEGDAGLTYHGNGEVSFRIGYLEEPYRCTIRFSREGTEFYFVHSDAPDEE